MAGHAIPKATGSLSNTVGIAEAGEVARVGVGGVVWVAGYLAIFLSFPVHVDEGPGQLPAEVVAQQPAGHGRVVDAVHVQVLGECRHNVRDAPVGLREDCLRGVGKGGKR